MFFKSNSKKILIYLVLIITALLVLAPIYWMANGSFKSYGEYLEAQPDLWPKNPTISNYTYLLNIKTDFTEESEIYQLAVSEKSIFPRSIRNSLIVSISSTILGIFACSLAGYAFAKYKFKGQDAIFLVILGMMMIPQAAVFIPNYLLMSKFGLIDTLWALILPTIAQPFGIFWMRQYIGRSVHISLIESARIDGCGELSIFFRIVLPIISPGLASLAIWLFMARWNDFILPLAYIQTNRNFTFPLFFNLLNQFPYVRPITILMAGSIMASLPVMIIFIIAQRRFISGMALGAIKE